MNVLKFGGTSVGSPERIKGVAELITSDKQRKIVVLSAMSGTTNTLVEIADYYRKRNLESANSVINRLRNLYMQHMQELYTDDNLREETKQVIDDIFTFLHSFSAKDWDETYEKAILAQGELMSTNMMRNYLREKGIKVQLISAFDYMRIDENGEPMLRPISEYWKPLLKDDKDTQIYLTQGFICLNPAGEIDNLQRGGSDYTACLIGAALKLKEIQIWTDIDGMHNNDPRFVENTRPVRQLNFEEAAELAYFGAKILHPTCIQPARYAGVPVRLLNTMQPEAPGTLINNEMQEGNIKAIAAKDNITAIKIVSSRMLLATGFLRKIFEIFEQYKTSIDMVTTSEVGVSLSIDNTSRLDPILEALRECGTVEVDNDMCIICVVGDLKSYNTGFEAMATDALSQIPIRMISYGGSNHNISFLIKKEYKEQALKSLSQKIFPTA